MSAFEAYGEQEKTAVANLNTHLEGLDKKLSEIKGFQSDEDYAQIDNELMDAFKRADAAAIKDFVTKNEVRRVP